MQYPFAAFNNKYTFLEMLFSLDEEAVKVQTIIPDPCCIDLID